MELKVIKRKEEILEKVYEKLNDELAEFEQGMLEKEKHEVYRASNQIDIIQNIYDMLMAQAEHFTAGTWTAILQSDHILELLYHEWMKADDSFWDELETSVKKSLVKVEKRQKLAGNMQLIGKAILAIGMALDKEEN